MSFLSSHVVFFLILILSFIMSLSSSSFVFTWLSLEINMMVFIPLIVAKDEVFNADSAMKYFVSQSAVSIVFLAPLLMVGNEEFLNNIMALAIYFKMGLVPLHSWLQSLFMVSSYYTLFLISSIQKLIPLTILSGLSFNTNLILVLGCGSVILISLEYNSNMSVRQVLFISTMGNSLWVISGAIFSESWLMFMMIYTVMNLVVYYSFFTLGLNKMQQLMNSTPLQKLLAGLSLMSLGGVPPLLGFLQKVLILKELIISGMMLWGVVLVFISILILFCYLVLVLTGFVVSSQPAPSTLYTPGMLATCMNLTFLGVCPLLLSALM